MPIYEFECPWCKSVQEELILPGDNVSRKVCKNCGKLAEKVMSVPGPTWKFNDTKSK